MVDTKRPCECDRGPVVYIITVRTVSGAIITESGLCKECANELAVTNALDALGLSDLAAKGKAK